VRSWAVIIPRAREIGAACPAGRPRTRPRCRRCSSSCDRIPFPLSYARRPLARVSFFLVKPKATGQGDSPPRPPIVGQAQVDASAGLLFPVRGWQAGWPTTTGRARGPGPCDQPGDHPCSDPRGAGFPQPAQGPGHLSVVNFIPRMSCGRAAPNSAPPDTKVSPSKSKYFRFPAQAVPTYVDVTPRGRRDLYRMGGLVHA